MLLHKTTNQFFGLSRIIVSFISLCKVTSFQADWKREQRRKVFFDIMNAHKHQQLWSLVMKHLALIWLARSWEDFLTKDQLFDEFHRLSLWTSTYWHPHAAEFDIVPSAWHSAFLTDGLRCWHDVEKILSLHSSIRN